ncbi:G-type lectin S-receptor-like serine/threonine-protein kinase SD2-5 [Cornus florida]|uniref:G-type lectin S-receptor-like serine/threonine-protein kinase SD2-5 n=1 Tax=Cornus florida TaxID=4283 RepID=UPI00289921F3|nr:G-type lectin S-receptor-like serine/threonine-protein kinase SD2-5 [Cornus florida]
MACFILILIISCFLSVCIAQFSSSTFHLNSNFPTAWHNNNSLNTLSAAGDDVSKVRVVLLRQRGADFVSGFYCADNCNYYVFSVVVVGGGNHSVVWSANRSHPVRENATLQLTRDGGLVLRDSNGANVWSTNTFGKSVAGMNMTAKGNLVLFNKEGASVWQSFEHHSDTMLIGQRLQDGQKLISRSSDKWSRGLYHAGLKLATGFAAYTKAGEGQPLMYYQLVPFQSSTTSRGSYYAELQQGAFIVKRGTSQTSFMINPTEFSSNEAVKYVKLQSDGHLKIYYHGNATGLREIADLITEDLGECQHPRQCGEYGLCREGQCSCAVGTDGRQYWRQTQLQLLKSGCSRITNLSCPPSLNQQHHLVEVRNVTYFNVIDSDAAFPNIRDLEGCKQACMQNCSCGAAFFRYVNDVSDGYCYMPSEILTIREGKIPNYNFRSATYIKVQIPYEAPDTVPGKENTGHVSPPTPHSKNGTNLAAIIAGSGAGAVLIFGLMIVFTLVRFLKTNTEDGEDSFKQVQGIPIRFSYEDLRVATGDFREELGRGGFGAVFKGMLGDGILIAVKRLDRSGQGIKEFLAEVETLGSINHFNLVKLIGFCADNSHRLLVYEYLSNGSLDKWIFYTDQRACLDWQARKKIILHIAKGLAYLHEECRQRIIHLDIKPQNILLDENFNAKVSDFGLAKLIDRDQSHVQTIMRGTPGYIAPELQRGRITTKADIYSFGIALLEIVCGRRNFDDKQSESSKHLLALLQRKGGENQLVDIVEHLDEEVQGHREEAVGMIKIGAWCLQNDQRRRPFMSTVVKVLEGVMEAETNIIYNFAHAMVSPNVANGHVSAPPQASVLSNPR